MRLRENFEIDDLAYDDVDSGAPPDRPRRYFADGGHADVGETVAGSGLPADQVKLQSTDIRPYMANSGLAQMQADVTTARYGGSSIQDSAAPQGAPYERPGGEPAGGFPRYDRSRFEQIVFKEMGGNPFEIDVIREVDRATAASMPQLFQQVFKGQAIWEDRARLNKKQMEFWNEEVKRYRAHVKERIESERRTRIDTYNFMMKNFDNEAKEYEAAAKRVQEKEKEFLKARQDQTKDTQKRFADLQKTKREILKRQAEILEKGTELSSGQLSPGAEAEFLELGNQLKYINAETHKVLMVSDPGYRAQKTKEEIPAETGAAQATKSGTGTAATAPAAEPSKSSAKAEPAAKPEVVRKKLPGQESAPTKEQAKGFKYQPHPLGEPVEVRRHRATGRLMGKMADGSIVWLEEIKG